MKKLLTLSLAATALLATSCSDETGTELKAGAESTVTFTTQLPDLGTRAFGEAANVKSLKYAVYESGKQTPLKMFSGAASKTEEMTSLTKNVTLQLTTGKTYDVIFWASADAIDAASKFDENTQIATLAPTVNNNDADDAFYAKATVTVSGNSQQTVELYRPYAQLNIGTDDFDAADAAGYTVTQTQVTVPAYSKLNLADGSVSEPVNVTYAYADIPASETFPVAGYKYLSMDYVLVPATKSVVDVSFAYTNGSDAKTRTFTSVPVQRNYRTNIYGSLLTSTTDFNVEIKPQFETPDYHHNVIEAKTQAEFVEAAKMPNATVKLEANTTYTLPEGDATIAEGVIIEGAEGTVMETKTSLLVAGGQTAYGVYNAQGLNNVTFRNLTINEGQGDYNAIKHSDNLTYENCVIIGRVTSHADHVTYKNCTFKQTVVDYNIWTYASDIVFDGCKFECQGKAINVYRDGSNLDKDKYISFKNCEFVASAEAGKAAIEIGSANVTGIFFVNIDNCTSTGFSLGSKSGNSLWNVKADKDPHCSKVFVDGAQVY